MNIETYKRHHFQQLVVLLMVCSFQIQGQDLHFSQLFNAPSLLNPAATGDFEGTWRLANLYRNQWSALDQPIRTLGVVAEQVGFLGQRSLSPGLILEYDESGPVGLTGTHLKGMLSYTIPGHRSSLRLGVSGGLVSWGISQWGTLPAQWNPLTGQYDPSLPTGEAHLGESILYPDVTFGLLAKAHSDRFRFRFGYSLAHINRPDISLSGRPWQLPLRHSGSAEISRDLSGGKTIQAFLLYSYMGTAAETYAGANTHFPVRGNGYGLSSYYAGLFLRTGINRNTDALVLSGGLDFMRSRLGLSYDLNVSGLHQSTGYRGGFEISFLFSGIDQLYNRSRMPCDRY